MDVLVRTECAFSWPDTTSCERTDAKGQRAATAAAPALWKCADTLCFPDLAAQAADVSDFWRQASPGPTALNAFRRWRRGGSSSGSSSGSGGDGSSGRQPGSDAAPEDDRALLKFLALNALELSAPATDVLLQSRARWFQLSGHPDCFAPAGPGTIWKKRSGGEDDAERRVYEALGADPLLRDLAPRYFREVTFRGQRFIELQDLLAGFRDPNVMDVKMGTRTFLESEVSKTTARHDLYQKMVQVDPSAPTPEEHEAKAVTKLRYMQFREQQSSTCSHGFRIEAMKFRGSPPVTDLKKVKSRSELLATVALFLGGREDVRQRLVARLREIRTKFEQSEYFKRHEVVGSSVFMIYDDTKVGAWIIDFAKTHPVPQGVEVTHRKPWIQGNHEEGFLFGLDSLIRIMEEVDLKQPPDFKNPIIPTTSVQLKS
ncbi:inositol-trisphosphate 3-kinase homolog isoform X2 [Schistocerca nitens]|uniref:inositol-trisphosphate 3-kinase homolog isoform X2 n=1 Tax=Schistocerca nitens TaxID=7011 RepID=UPI002118535A|nr:inositol-trisphosphate 3-kinase homolog isoform X2 [Schistocerca nitens]